MGTEIKYETPIQKRIPYSRLLEVIAAHGGKVVSFSEELWFISKIKSSSGEWKITEGLTTPEARRERCRQAIRLASLENVKCGKRSGSVCTFADIFQVVYGQPL